MKNQLVCFDDVILTPRYSDILSRSSISLDTFLNLGNSKLKFSLPVVSSPMDTVTESEMCLKMIKMGGLGVIHRYNAAEQQAKIAADVVDTLLSESHEGASKVAAAIGVSGDYVDRAQLLYSSGVRIFCVDIAHGHHILMRKAIEKLRDVFGDSVHIMAGNVATLDGFNDLADWGADSIRVGIGGGSICSTRIQTGHGRPTLQSVMDCSRSDRDAIMIADGGIRNSGDIVKSYAAGADFVMLGSMLSGTDETPGEIFEHPEIIEGRQVYSRYKKYRGMASVEAQIDWRGHFSSEEGVTSKVPYKGPVESILRSVMNGVKSGLSYSGCKDIRRFKHISQFSRSSTLSSNENATHIFSVT